MPDPAPPTEEHALEAADLRLRAAGPDDVAVLLRFIRELAEYEREPAAVVADEALLREALTGPHPDAEAILAELDGEPVGMALFFHNFSTWLGRRGLYLEDLYVTPSARGSGVGRALLGYLARLALARGCGRLEWWVLDWNEPALGFYRELGAEALGEWLPHRVTGEALRRLAGEGEAP